MRLTGIPLFLLVATAAVGTMAATVRGWRRLPVRIAGLLAVEILAVAAIGLWVNRSQRFYPTWESLTGASQVAAVTETAAGRLDPRLAGATRGRLETGRGRPPGTWPGRRCCSPRPTTQNSRIARFRCSWCSATTPAPGRPAC